MTVTLTPQAEAMIRAEMEQDPNRSPEEVIECALLVASQTPASRAEWHMTPADAVADILELRKEMRLGDLSVKDLVTDGRKY